MRQHAAGPHPFGGSGLQNQTITVEIWNDSSDFFPSPTNGLVYPAAGDGKLVVRPKGRDRGREAQAECEDG